MNPILNFPSDEFAVGKSINIDIAADYLEMSALFSKESQSFSEDIVNALELAADTEYDDVDAEVRTRGGSCRESCRPHGISETGSGNIISI